MKESPGGITIVKRIATIYSDVTFIVNNLSARSGFNNLFQFEFC
jgi:hypothetical protein